MPDNMPILGTTAAASDRVVEDIQTQLGRIKLQRGALIRHSLALQNMRLPSQAARLAWLARRVPEPQGTGIIYTLTKRDSDQVAAWLAGRGVAARAYYGDVKHADFADSDSYRQ